MHLPLLLVPDSELLVLQSALQSWALVWIIIQVFLEGPWYIRGRILPRSLIPQNTLPIRPFVPQAYMDEGRGETLHWIDRIAIVEAYEGWHVEQ